MIYIEVKSISPSFDSLFLLKFLDTGHRRRLAQQPSRGRPEGPTEKRRTENWLVGRKAKLKLFRLLRRVGRHPKRLRLLLLLLLVMRQWHRVHLLLRHLWIPCTTRSL